MSELSVNAKEFLKNAVKDGGIIKTTKPTSITDELIDAGLLEFCSGDIAFCTWTVTTAGFSIARLHEVDALKAENEKLRKALNNIEAVIDTDFERRWETDLNTCISQLLNEEIAIKKLCIEALAPVEEKQSCPVCNGAGIVSIRNGDDDCTCPACGDKPMSTDELVEEITGK